MKKVANLWLLAIATIATALENDSKERKKRSTTEPEFNALLYLGADGTLIVQTDENDKLPPDARYVCQVGNLGQRDHTLAASRLQYVAQGRGS